MLAKGEGLFAKGSVRLRSLDGNIAGSPRSVLIALEACWHYKILLTTDTDFAGFFEAGGLCAVFYFLGRAGKASFPIHDTTSRGEEFLPTDPAAGSSIDMVNWVEGDV